MKNFILILSLILILSFFTFLLDFVCKKYFIDKNNTYSIEITDCYTTVYDSTEKKSGNILMSFKASKCSIANDFFLFHAENADGKIFYGKNYLFRSDILDLMNYRQLIDFEHLTVFHNNKNKITFEKGRLNFSDNTLESKEKVLFDSENYRGYAKSCFADLNSKNLVLNNAKLEIYTAGF